MNQKRRTPSSILKAVVGSAGKSSKQSELTRKGSFESEPPLSYSRLKAVPALCQPQQKGWRCVWNLSAVSV